jgi:hypothetical protein
MTPDQIIEIENLLKVAFLSMSDIASKMGVTLEQVEQVMMAMTIEWEG